MGPLLARRGRAIVAPPGGDFPARRTIRTHLEALRRMGVRVLPRVRACARGARRAQAGVVLSRRSVGHRHRNGAARGGRAPTACPRSATPPASRTSSSSASSCAAWAPASRARASHTIRVEGVASAASGAKKTLCGDYIEAGSWAVVAAITGGDIEVGGTRPEDMEVVSAVLQKMNVALRARRRCLRVEPRTLIGAGRITTGLWPGFPSDLVSLVTVLATQAAGATLVHDWLYELRLFSLEQMSGMGADLFLCDPHRIIVTGPRQLRGKQLDSRDIRSGMALIAAALAAEGQSRVDQLEIVERGYAGWSSGCRRWARRSRACRYRSRCAALE